MDDMNLASPTTCSANDTRIIANDWLDTDMGALIARTVDRVADLSDESAGLVDDNERRWRVFHQRVVEIVGDARERTEIGP
jgi:hypothetical protein